MPQRNVSISSSLQKSVILERLALCAKKNPSFRELLSKKLDINGVIEEHSFDVETGDAPPMRMKGHIEEKDGYSVIHFSLVYDSLRKGFEKMFMALLYPILFVVFLISVIQNPSNIWAYILTALAIPVIYIGAKILLVFNYSSPNPDRHIKQMISLSKGKLEADELIS